MKRTTQAMILGGGGAAAALTAISIIQPAAGEAVTAVGTLIAGVAAAYAATQSASAARDTRAALALHYRPEGTMMAHLESGPLVAPPGGGPVPPGSKVKVSAAVHIVGSEATDHQLRWTDSGGQTRTRDLPDFNTPQELTGCAVITGQDGSMAYAEIDAQLVEFICRDKATRTRWTARPQLGATHRIWVGGGQFLKFEPHL